MIALTGNPVAAHNAVLVVAYTLAALGAAALAARLAGPTPAALVAGVAYAYAPRLLHQAHNLQTLSAFWFPWLFLALERVLVRPTWTAAALLGGVALGLALSSLIAFAFAAVIATVFVTTAAAARGWRPGRAHVVRLAAVAVPVAAALAAYVAPYRAVAREWGLRRGLAEVEQYSLSLPDLAGVPPEHLWHRLLGLGRVVDLDHEALFPGLTVGVLAAIGLMAAVRDRQGLRPALLPYLVAAAAALILAFGTLPYQALHAVVPGFDAIRTPRRFAGFVSLGLALVAAAGAARLVAGLTPARRGLAVAGLGGLVLFESLSVPFPGTVRRLDAGALPEAYRWLATQPAATLALELPMDADWQTLAGAAFHLRRTVNGWSSYAPPHYYAFVGAMAGFPDARSLTLIRGVRPDVVLVDRARLGPGRAAALAALGSRLRLERTVGTHDIYRLAGPAPPGPEALIVEATPPACVTVRNPGRELVPLYPLRRLRLVAGAETKSLAWLPLDLAPGASYTACADGSGVPVRGRIEEP